MKRPFIIIDRRWSLVVAAVAGLAFGTALAREIRRARMGRRRADERMATTDLHEWEGEGGSLAPATDPATGTVYNDRTVKAHRPTAH